MYVLLLSFLERALHQYFSLDPEACDQLSALSGKVLKLHLSDWSTSLYLYPHATGIQIKTHATHHDTEITTTSLTLLRLSLAVSPPMVSSEIQIKGDARLAQALMRIFSHIDINWEDLVSRYTGDIIAHKLGRFTRHFKRYVHFSKDRFLADLSQYLQNEAQYLPSEAEMQDFFEDLSALRHGVARLQAHIHIQKNESI